MAQAAALPHGFELPLEAEDISRAMETVFQGISSLIVFHTLLVQDVRPTLFGTRLTVKNSPNNSDKVLLEMTLATLEANINLLQDRTADLFVGVSCLVSAETMAKARERYPHLHDPSTWAFCSPSTVTDLP